MNNYRALLEKHAQLSKRPMVTANGSGWLQQYTPYDGDSLSFVTVNYVSFPIWHIKYVYVINIMFLSLVILRIVG